MKRKYRGGLRAGVGIADQMLYSLTNFALTVIVAREVSAKDFGAYSLVIATYLIGVSVIRGLTSETLMVRFSASGQDEWSRAATDACAAATMLGLAAGLGVVALSFFVGSLASMALTFGILFPGLVLQDYLRFAAMSAGRPGLALLNDATQAVVQFSVAAVLVVITNPSVWMLVAAWGGAAYFGAAVGAIALRLPLRASRALIWLRGQFDLAGRYALDDLASQGSQQATTYVLAGVAGLTDAGALRGAQTVFGPPSILNLGVQAAVTRELVRVLSRSANRMRRYVAGLSLGLGTVGLLWGTLALLCPRNIGEALFGTTWVAAHPLLVYFVVAQTANGVRVGPTVGLRAMGAANHTLTARLIVTVLGLVSQIVGAMLAGATGVAVATAVVTPVQGAVWWWQFEVACLEQRRKRASRRRAQAWSQLLESVPNAEALIGSRTTADRVLPLMKWPET